MALKILHTDKRDACGEILTKLTQIVEEGHLRPLLDSKLLRLMKLHKHMNIWSQIKQLGK